MKQPFENSNIRINQQLEIIANMLSVEPLEKIDDVSFPKKDEDKNGTRRNVEFINKVLERELTIIGNRILEQAKTQNREDRDRLQMALNAINNGEENMLTELGLYFSYTQMQDILTTMIQGKFPLEIQTITASPITQYNAQTGQFAYTPWGFSANDIVGIELSVLFRKIAPVARNIRLVITINEFLDNISKRQLTKYERDQYVLILLYFLESKGVIQPEDTAGLDFFVVRESLQVPKVDLLITQLRQSPKGKIIMDDEDGCVYFKPDAEFIESLGFSSALRRRELATYGLLLKDAQGIPTAHALDAAGYLNPINKHFIHLNIVDKQMEAEQDRTYALLRALNITKKELFHNIFFDSGIVSSDIIVYSVAKMFQIYVQKILHSSTFYNEWPEFDAYEYAERNFNNNGEILPEDKQIIKHAIKAFTQLGIKPASLEKVADVGTGPNIYPAMLLSPFVTPDTKIELLEFSPHRSYLAKLIGETIDPKHANIWKKFEEFMIKTGGELYEGCEKVVKRQAKIQFGDIFDLPQGNYDFVSSYFVAESIVDSQMPFREAIQSLGKAVKPSGILMVAHMVGSEGYYAGVGTHFPAINLTVEEIKHAYMDADLEIISLMAVGHDNDAKVREGYHGMCLVIAQPKFATTATPDLIEAPKAKKEKKKN
ncbi:hypothetical protein HZA75_04120 [Candidatus Roizmanbacteria bacterium]|nr:hypothetical protein [Candidatus Roizmanbacteria bacterium]